MDQKNCIPYFVNTPPPNIRKDLGDGSRAEESKCNISRNAIKLDANASQKMVNRYIQSNSPEKGRGLVFNKFGTETNEYINKVASAISTTTSMYSRGNNSVTGLRDDSYAMPQTQTDRYRPENNLKAVNNGQQNYLLNRLKKETEQSNEDTSTSSLSSNIDFSRPPPMNQIPHQQYHLESDRLRSAEVTKLPSINSGSPVSILKTSPNRAMQQNGSVRSPQSVARQQSSRPQSSGSSLGPPQSSQRSSQSNNMTRTPEALQGTFMAMRPPPRSTPPTAHSVWPTETTDMQFVKTKPPPTGVRPAIQPPMPAGPPPSSTPPPPPPPGPPPPGPPTPGTPTTGLPCTTPPPHFMQGPPFFFAIGSYSAGGLFKVPPPPIGTPTAVPGTVFQGSPTKTYYIQENTYVSHPNPGYNHYKRNRVSDNLDPELRRGSKKKKKSLAQILPQRKGWSEKYNNSFLKKENQPTDEQFLQEGKSVFFCGEIVKLEKTTNSFINMVEDAKKAIEIEKECSKGARKYSLFIKFPDPELNREIVSSFHSAIESVHFQQPSTPRFCFVNISSSADPEAVRQELNKVQFGGGYLSAEFKKDREDDFNINPEDIDPTTLYVGNLAQEVTKDDMLRMYPKNKRIDIGYAKKMKFTRYAFVVFKTAADAMEAYKRTHDTQMYHKSLIVRFRRMNGTIGMLGEPKVQSKTETDQIQNSSETNDQVPLQENETEDHSLWDIDVSTWETNYNETYDDVDDEDMMDVKPSLEDLEKDVKVPREYVAPFLPGPIDFGDLPRPKKLDEIKKEKATEEGPKEHAFSDDQDRNSTLNEAQSPRLPEGHSDSVNTSTTGEVGVSNLSNTVTVKNELGATVKAEVDGNPVDKTLRSTYRQLMLARTRKRLKIKVEGCSNTVEGDSEKDESLDPENENMDRVCSQEERTQDSIRASPIKSSDRSTSQRYLENPSPTADGGKQIPENGNKLEVGGKIKKEIKHETPDSPTKRFISTYADLREVGRKMKNVNRVEVKKENEKVNCDLQDDQMRDVGAHEIESYLSPERHEHTDTADQTEEGENVQPSELTRNEDNLTNAINNSQTNNTQCLNKELEFDSLTGISARQNEASEQENDEFSFDVDLNKMDNIKKEPRAEDDNENDADLDEDDDEDDDIENFLKRRKALI